MAPMGKKKKFKLS